MIEPTGGSEAGEEAAFADSLGSGSIPMGLEEADPKQRRLSLEQIRLVEAAKRGDRSAFARLYSEFGPVVHGVLLAARGPKDADDLTQEVFLRALRRLEDLRDPHALGSWLCSIARNVARDAGRTIHKTGVLPEDLPEAVVTDHDTRDLAAAVLNVVLELPEAYRETLTLRLVEGLSGPEIAMKTGLTQGSVRVNLCRGMKLLSERLKERRLP